MKQYHYGITWQYKDPWIFQLKVDTRSSKTGNAPNDLKLKTHWGVLCMHERPLGPKFWFILLYNYLFSRYKAAENQKCTEWPQTELGHLTIKTTLYTLHTYPWGPNFGPFHRTTSHFPDTKSSKIGNALNGPNWTWTLNSQKYPVYTDYLHQRPKFWSVSLYD